MAFFYEQQFVPENRQELKQPPVIRMRAYLWSTIKLDVLEIPRWMTLCKSEKDLEWVAFIFQINKKGVQKKIEDIPFSKNEQEIFFSYLCTTSEGKNLFLI
ncbi:hypothetical protein [Coxiella endosymbiont of Ornithodoros amblus]|uniref:hypothetical protein n=1 Tax=Coxiella endosymbiont of Ornithodoros amblus TaxID=1656166 RepID=UPI00244DD9BA|nr:hypothetical protein [Coxiella endosymbiont of Ornithodoros amblus]